MDIWLLFIAGVIIGLFIFYMRNKSDICGNLRIDRSQKDEQPYLFLELSKEVKDICSKKYVVFRVRDENFDTHK